MTLRKWSGLYKHFRNYYDFTLTKRTFYETEQKIEKEETGEWFDD